MWPALLLSLVVQAGPVTECGEVHKAWDDTTARGPYRALQFEFVHQAEFAIIEGAALASTPPALELTGAVVCITGVIDGADGLKKVFYVTDGGTVTIKRLRPFTLDEAVALFAREQSYLDGIGPEPEFDRDRLRAEHRAFFLAALRARIASNEHAAAATSAHDKERRHRETMDALIDGVNHIGDVFRADLAEQQRSAAERAADRRAPIEQPFVAVPRARDYGRPTRTRVDGVSPDGALVRLRDGSAWRVDTRDQARTSRWSPAQRVSVVRRSGNEVVLVNSSGDTIIASRVD